MRPLDPLVSVYPSASWYTISVASGMFFLMTFRSSSKMSRIGAGWPLTKVSGSLDMNQSPPPHVMNSHSIIECPAGGISVPACEDGGPVVLDADHGPALLPRPIQCPLGTGDVVELAVRVVVE